MRYAGLHKQALRRAGRTRLGQRAVLRLEEHRLAIRPEDLLHRVSDLIERRPGPRTIEYVRNQVGVSRRRRT